jgi:transcriptional regulator GlxA family with amidase domain
MHRVVIVALDRVVSFDLALAADTFLAASGGSEKPRYRVRVCGVQSEVSAGTFCVRMQYGLSELARADTIILPGLSDLDAVVPEVLVRALHKAAARGVRIATICSGAFLLAATGLLDGRRATTHWRAAPELARRFPNILVDPDVLYVDEGQFLTSAGAAAGIDLCLHMIRLDFGAAVAAETARISVMPLERAGGQSQFIVHEQPAPEGASLAALLEWMERQLHKDHTLQSLARRAGMSVRSLNRRFREQTGTTPLRWLIRARVRRAQQLLETTSHSIEVIAQQVGFSSATALREHFRRVVDTSPNLYRRAFRPAPQATPLRAASA